MAQIFGVSVDDIMGEGTGQIIYTEQEKELLERWKMIVATDPTVASHLERELQLLIELLELREKK